MNALPTSTKMIYLPSGTGEHDLEDLANVARYLSSHLEKDDQKDFADAFMPYFNNETRQCEMDWALVDLLLKYAPKVLEKEASPQLIEGFFAVVFFIKLEMCDDFDKMDSCVSLVISILTNKVDGNAKVRCLLLQKLFNMYPPEACQKYKTFKALLEYAASVDLFDEMIAPYLPYLAGWLNTWRLSDAEKMDENESDPLSNEQKAGICYTVSQKKDFADRLSWLKLYLKYTSQLTDQAVAAVKQVIVDAFNCSLTVSVDDLVSLPIVLKAEAKLPELVKLLKTFQSGTLEDLKKLHAQYPKIFEANGINQQDIYRRIHVLTLVSICEGKTEVPLEDIRKGLGIDEVENVIVSAIGKGVVGGRIDHLRQKLVIQSLWKRHFGKPQWQALGQEIDKWIAKLDTIPQGESYAGA